MQKPTLVLVLNWLLLIVLLFFSLLGFIVFMLTLAMTGNGKKKAAALMARQAYIFERSARIDQVSPLSAFKSANGCARFSKLASYFSYVRFSHPPRNRTAHSVK